MQKRQDSMARSPTDASDKHLRELHITTVIPQKKQNMMKKVILVLCIFWY
jgi:hypothetical protein